MSDAIKRPGAAGSSDDVAGRPDVGFHDDHVGSHLKAEEAAKRRAAQGVAQRRPKRIDVEPQQVGAVSHYRASEDDKARHQQQRQQRGLVRGKGPQRAAPARAGEVKTAAVEEDVRRLAGRIDLLLHTLGDLEQADAPTHARIDRREDEAGEGDGDRGRDADRRRRAREALVAAQDAAAGEGAEDAAAGDALAEARWQKTARDMRFLLQHLVAGGVGLTLTADPAATFGPLFANLARWPRRVPPGRLPASEADYDLFLRWVFRPEDGHLEAAQELAQLTRG